MKFNNSNDNKSLSSSRIAFLYFGVLMGAGFASGKEMWQFFGVFGAKGFPGVCITAVLFIVLGILIVTISRALNTGDLSKIIFPYEHPLFEKIIGIVVAAFLFMAYFAMLAAGGSLAETQFGIPRALGSFVLMLLAVLTAVKGFSMVSDRLGKVVPVLLGATLILSFIILMRGAADIEAVPPVMASPLAPNWVVGAVVFVSYNMMGAIPVLGSCAVYAEDQSKVRIGAVLGGFFLGGCSLILYLVTLTDPLLAENSPLPMLSFAKELTPVAGTLYSFMLLLSVFGTATSCFYGYCTKLPQHNRRKHSIWVSAITGLAFSMMGFTNIVAFIYPLEGYFGFVFLVLMTCNYFRIKMGLREKQDPDLTQGSE